MERNQERQGICIGIDFGTTFSAVAWASTTEVPPANVVTNWPGVPTDTEGDVPSSIPSLLAYRADQGKTWGFQIPWGAPCYEGFKRSLWESRREQISSRLFNKDRPIGDGAPPHADDLVVDYLEAIRLHVETFINAEINRLGLYRLEFSYVMAHPSLESEYLRLRVRDCALRAGLRPAPIQLVTEPEAALIHTFKTRPPPIKRGETVIVCDSGGGTTDLESFLYIEEDPMKLRKVATSRSGSSGGSDLNVEFRKFLDEKLRNVPGWGNAALQAAMNYFEITAKRKFSGPNSGIFKIPVYGMPDGENPKIKKARLHLSGADLGPVFAPTVRAVVSLMKDQIEETKSRVEGKLWGVILVGGFSGSPFLFESLRSEIPEDIEIWQPPNASTAVARGALQYGLSETSPLVPAAPVVPVLHQTARKHYGVEIRTPAKLGVDYGSIKVSWDSYHGHHSVMAMKWLVIKGETVSENFPVEELIPQIGLANARFKETVVNVYQCDDPQNNGPPAHAVDESMRVVATLTPNVDVIDRAGKHRRGKDQKDYVVVDLTVRVIFKRTECEFSLLCDNTTCAMTRVSL